jgi:hypothetical protein
MLIEATGIRDGKKTTVKVVNGAILIDGDVIISEIDKMDLTAKNPIAGTYYPEPDSETNILNNLHYHFFDASPDINTEGEAEEIPYDKDVIY